MAASDADLRRGALILELLVALVLVAVAGGAVVALLLYSAQTLERGELRGRAAPHLRELELAPEPDLGPPRALGAGTLSWDAIDEGLRVRLEATRDPSRPVGIWVVPRPAPPDEGAAEGEEAGDEGAAGGPV